MTGWLIAHAAVVLVVLATGTAALLMLRQRRTSQAAMAWLLAFLLVPYLAIPTFLLLGFRRGGLTLSPIRLPAHTDAPSRGSLDAALRAGGLPAPSAGNAIALHGGATAWDTLDGLISDARSSIDAQFFLVANDAVGRRFVERLTERAREGLRVRLLIDAVGGAMAPRSALSDLRSAGGEVRWNSPVMHLPTKGRLNQRNHRKMLIADGARVFAGGMNVGADYIGIAGRDAGWTDLSYTLEGPAVADHVAVFASGWGVEPERPSPASATGHAVVQLVPSGPDMPRDALHDALVHGLHCARDRVRLVTPYFVPTESLLEALSMTARRGVDIVLVVPVRSNHLFADIAGGPDLRALRRDGVKILRSDRMVHAKAGLVDGTGWIGSANLDARSLLLNYESVLFLHDSASVARLSDWIDRLAETCIGEEIPLLWPRRMAESVVRLAAPVL